MGSSSQHVTRSLASVTLWFSQIPIEVKVYLSATKKFERFCWLSPKGNLVRLRYEDAVTQEALQYQEMDRAVRIGTRAQRLSKKEWEEVGGKKRNLIEIREALLQQELSPFSIERNYFLAPQRKSYKPYRLLQRLLYHDKKALLGKWYISNGQDRFVMISSSGTALMMSHLYYHSELRILPLSFAPETAPSPKEVSLAKQLLDRLTAERVSLGSYQDEWSQRLSALVESKPKLGNLLKRSLREKRRRHD